MRALLDELRRYAATDANVLITGETGAGKDTVARALHESGPRRHEPFVPVDCPALPATLLESELFGHERGAFTDATSARAGRFEIAGRGSIYLDRVNELPLEIQPKLLRLVEGRRGERLGSNIAFDIRARIISSVEPGIEDKVRDGSFRRDLYHRLNVLLLEVPPLRERVGDMLPLARTFLKRAAARIGRTPPALTAQAAEALQAHLWPGNVRELRHTIERAFQSADGGAITLDHLPPEILEAPALHPETALARRPTLEEVERRYIAATLRHARGSQTDAARLLGISRKALWEKRKRYGME